MIWMWIARNKIGTAALVLSAVLGAACLGLWLSLQVEASRADREKRRADREEARATRETREAMKWEASYDDLRQAVAGQQAAVRDLVERAGEATRHAQEAADRAARASRASLARAAAIQAERPPPEGVDPCEAARQAFARELREERPDAP